MDTTQEDQIALLWGRVPVVAGTGLDIGMARISEDLADDKLDHILRTTLRTHAETDAGRVLAGLPSNVLLPDNEGATARSEAGLVSIHLDDLDSRARGGLLGYAGVVDGVVVLLVMSSAIEQNLPALEGARLRRGRNAFTEALIEAIEVVEPVNLVAARFDRLSREVGEGGQLLSALREAGTSLWDEGGQLDLSDPGQLMVAGVKGSMSDTASQQRKSDTFGGRINIIESGGRDTAWHSLPPGYGPKYQEIGGRSVPVKKTVEARTDLQKPIQRLWEMFAAGATRQEIGWMLHDHHWPLRGVGQGTAADTRNGNKLLNLAHRLLVPGHLELHATGVRRTVRRTGSKARRPGGKDVRRSDDGRRETEVVGQWPVPRVDGRPWGLSEEVIAGCWKRFDREAARRDSQEAPAKNTTGAGFPLVDFRTWSGDTSRFRLVHTHTTLQLRSTALPADEDAAWDAAASSLVASSNATTAVNRLGEALIVALGEIAGRTAQLTTSAEVESPQLSALRAEMAEATHARDEALADAEAKDALAISAMRAGDTDDAEQQRSGAATLRRRAGTLDDEIERFAVSIARVQNDDLDERADLSQPLGVAAALARFDGAPASEELRRMVSKLGIAQSLRVRYEPARGVMSGAFAAQIPLLDETVTELPVRFEWPDTSPARGTDVSGELVERWVEGASLEDLANTWNRTTLWVWQQLDGWFSERDVVQVGALLDCPIVSVREIVHAAVSGQVAPEGVSEATAKLVTDGFMRDGCFKAFVGYPSRDDQMLLRALELAGGEADIAVLEAAGVPKTAVDRAAKPHGRRPALVTKPSQGRRRRLDCPHCDGWASHLIYTPPTADWAVICPSCRKVPDPNGADAPLPEEFLRYWDRVSGGRTLIRGVSTQEASPADCEPPHREVLEEDLIRIGEVRTTLAVGYSCIQDLRASGRLPAAHRTVRNIELWRRQDIEELARERSGRERYSIKDGRLSPAQAAPRLGVNEHSVRWYCKNGWIAHAVTGGSYRMRPEVVEAFTPPAGDLEVAMNLTDVARTADVPRNTVTAAIEHGELATVRSRTSLPHVLPDEFARWNAQRQPDVDLVAIGEVARAVGRSPKRIRRLANAGAIPVTRTRGGTRLFRIDEVKHALDQHECGSSDDQEGAA